MQSLWQLLGEAIVELVALRGKLYEEKSEGEEEAPAQAKVEDEPTAYR